MSKEYDSVFDSCAKDELEFDTTFDQEDSLVDLVAGFNEAGDPLTGVEFEELHQTKDDDVTPCDIKKELGDNNDSFGAKDMEGLEDPEFDDMSAKGEIGKESEADQFTKDHDDDYQDGLKGPKPDDSDVTKSIDDVLESNDIDDELEADDDDILECNESGDADIDDVLDSDYSTDDMDIDEVLDEDEKATMNLDYETSDEDLIDLVANGDV